MNTRATSAFLLLFAFACSLSCEPPDHRAAADAQPATPGLTPNREADAGGPTLASDAGEADAGAADAGPVDSDDAGVEDAGPVCPPFSRASADGCQVEVSVRLTGTAAAIRGDTLYAGTGQQPVLEVFFSGPTGLSPDEVTIAVGRSLAQSGDGGPIDAHAISSVTADDAGMHYDLPWPTTQLAEGTYQARATVILGDAGFTSNAVRLLVDRTPPAVDLKLSFDSVESEQPRDFRATAAVVATDDGGSGEVTIALSGTGVSLLKGPDGISTRETTKVDLPAELPTVEGDRTTLQTRIHAGDIPYDAWSTKADDFPIEIQATATDLVGNVASAKVSVPVTREIWHSLTIDTSGALSIGLQGQVLVNSGLTLDTLLPDGSLQSRIKIVPAAGAAQIGYTGAPETLVSKKVPQGQVFVPSLVNHQPVGVYGQVSSVGASDSFAPVTSPAAMALAVSAGRGLVYVLSKDCGLRSLDAISGADETPAGKINPFPASCAGAQLALGKDHLIATSATIQLSYALSPLNGDWSAQSIGPQGAAPVFLGNIAVFDLGWDLELFDPWTGPADQLMGVGTADHAKVATSSLGDVFVLQSNGVLTKLSSKGVKAWDRKLGTGLLAPGLAIGTGAELIYAVDGAGTLSTFDSDGYLRWQSLSGHVQGDPLIDHCTGHAYASTLGTPMAVVVDSFGLDMGAGGWPVRGHDVFQTYDAEGTADVDCSDHL